MSEDRSSMLYWFPKIQNLGIPVPKTEIVPFLGGFNYIDYLEGEELPKKPLAELKRKAKRIGYPLFMRTDQLSGKHSLDEWIPFIENEEMLVSRIFRLIEKHATAGIFGLPLNALVVREFLDLESSFKAFGGTPIARERRYFINDGEIICHHPYWVEDAIQFWLNGAEPKKWRVQLRDLNNETNLEIDILLKHAVKVASVMEGYWSVDFARTKNGIWYLIDMAEGNESWHPECNKALGGERGNE